MGRGFCGMFRLPSVSLVDTPIEHVEPRGIVTTDGARREFDMVAPTEEATAAFHDELRAAIPDTVWDAGCNSWYLGADGTPAMWPWDPQHHARYSRSQSRRTGN